MVIIGIRVKVDLNAQKIRDNFPIIKNFLSFGLDTGFFLHTIFKYIVTASILSLLNYTFLNMDIKIY